MMGNSVSNEEILDGQNIHRRLGHTYDVYGHIVVYAHIVVHFLFTDHLLLCVTMGMCIMRMRIAM